MKNGFTTGSCAAAAAKASAFMLLSGNRIDRIRIRIPAGIIYSPEVEEVEVSEQSVSCAVRKDGGDDPDLTDGMLIFAKVRILSESAKETKNGARRTLINLAFESAFIEGTKNGACRTPESLTSESAFREEAKDGAHRTPESLTSESRIRIVGGPGVGIVKRPGLDQPVGNAAINSVPRQMIRKEVGEMMEQFDFPGSLEVMIYVPGGEELAGKTFNPRLGIEGGISIIGTTGIVEPMSTRAILETIRLELNQLRETGTSEAVISPGNNGMAFMKERFGYDLDKAVKCSNYIGETIDLAAELGFTRLLLCGHIGKLIKVSGGIMNTHSREADCRMELMAAAAARSGASGEVLNKILDCLSTEEAYACYLKTGIDKQCMAYLMERISFHLDARAAGRLQVHCMVYSGRYGLLGMTDGAEEILHSAAVPNHICSPQ